MTLGSRLVSDIVSQLGGQAILDDVPRENFFGLSCAHCVRQRRTKKHTLTTQTNDCNTCRLTGPSLAITGYLSRNVATQCSKAQRSSIESLATALPVTSNVRLGSCCIRRPTETAYTFLSLALASPRARSWQDSLLHLAQQMWRCNTTGSGNQWSGNGH